MQYKNCKTKHNSICKSFILLITLSLVLISSACTASLGMSDGISHETGSLDSSSWDNASQQTSNTLSSENSSATESEGSGKVTGQLKVHFLDVGQADCILLQNGSSAMLIDAGNNADGKFIIDYIKKLKIKKLDYVIGTHPHEDHIGSLDKVISTFNIGKVLMPKVTASTHSFEDVIRTIKSKGLKITTPVAGSEFQFGDCKCSILAPNSTSYEDINNYSIVLKVSFGKTSFLFTGDAENISEDQILAGKYDLKADVLKVGHHGSNSSSSARFLKAVSPEYAIISVGKDNDFGHPSSKTLKRLASADVKVYRTDKDGTIVVSSDGSTITDITR